MVKAMCRVQLKDGRRSADLILIFCLNETMHQLAMANSVHWYGDVFMSMDGHVLRRALHFEVE